MRCKRNILPGKLDSPESGINIKAKGSYVLLIELPKGEEILIGKLGFITFPQGFYAYVGSAMNGLSPRINYHLRHKARPHWHIDYFLAKASIREIIVSETGARVECALAHALAKRLKPIPGFGCTDCKCHSHLYFSEEQDKLREEIIKAFSRIAYLVRL